MTPCPHCTDTAILSNYQTTLAAWLVLLTHLLGIGFSLHALMRKHSPQGTIAWLLGLNLLPLITIPLYLALGAERIRRHTEERLPANAVSAMLKGIRGKLVHPLPESTGRTLTHTTGIPPCTGNRVILLQDGRDTYAELTEAIRNAKTSILIEFFIIRNDVVGINFRKLLEEKAREGISVRIIYDEIGSHKLPRGYLRALRSAGVRIASFNGRRFWWSSFLRINYRNHRKLVIIDSTIAYLGSLNVGLEYVQLPGQTYWRDTFVKLQGPIVAQCLLSFAEDWQRATGQNISHLAQEQADAGETQCQLIPSGPDDTPLNNWQLLLLEIVSRARKRLWLASPYFVPDQAVYAALAAASLRGVQVRILVPQKGDSTMANLALLSYLPDIASTNIQILAYTPGFLHEKIALADDATCCIGTANLDERSLRLNFELTLLIEDSEMTARVEQLLLRDMTQAQPLHPQIWYSTPLLTRLSSRLCRLLSPVL
ncbi:MAG: cardiolipin synthase [Akkermansia sp.]|nr:cardiolipin synthase [Akkermansia sp.]